MKHLPLTLTGMLALCLAVPVAFAAETSAATPIGHKDFVPTPERPMNFRAGGNGWYPGATPPTEWSEGTPVQVDRKGTFGNPPKEGVAKVWDFADTKSKNILWKVPVPGWGYAHPIVVRDRVISLGSPHFVTCYDLKTGKQLWQREALPLLCDGQPEDKARTAQVAIDLAMAICKWGANEGIPFALVTLDGVKSAEGFQERAAKVSRMLAKYRPAVEKIGDPDLLTALDADLALMTSWEKTTNAVQTISNLPKRGQLSKFAALVDKKFKVSYSNTWSGFVGFSDAAPASDGERIYAVFGQGQIVCYDLQGNLLWAKRLESKNLLNGNGFASNRQILLVGDRLVVKDMHTLGQKRLLCFHAKTGDLLWTYPLRSNNFMAERRLRLNAPDGAPVDVIITPEHHKIVRLSDGKELGEFRAEKNAPHYHVLAWDDTDTIVVGGKSTGGPTEPSACYRIKMTGPDSATGEVVYELAGNPMTPLNCPTATDTHIFSQRGGIYDRKTGAKVGQWQGLGQSSVIAGNYLITQGGSSGPYGRNREDNMATCDWRVFDISDPAKPRLVNQGLNLLGYKDPPADYIVKTYLAEFDPFLFAGCYKGTPSWFGTDLAGVVPHGDKVLIQSSAFLYCVGPAIEGVPGDNPATVQAIRAAKPADLATYLKSPSALYRHTAVTAMIGAGIGGSKEALTKLAKEDPYEQIRAAAILALNAAEPDAVPGTQALLPLMTAAWAGGNDDVRPERRALQLTLEALGKERGIPLLVAAFTKTDAAAIRQSIVDFAAVMGWAAPELTRQAQAYLASNVMLAVRYLSHLVATDKDIREALKTAYPTFGWNLLAVVATPLGQALKGEEKIAFLLHGIRIAPGGGIFQGTNISNIDYRVPFLRQLQAMGREGASAIPELEKLAAAHAHLATEFAPVIEAIKGK